MENSLRGSCTFLQLSLSGLVSSDVCGRVSEIMVVPCSPECIQGLTVMTLASESFSNKVVESLLLKLVPYMQ